MKQISLRHVAIYDLYDRYARTMDDGTIRQYAVPLAAMLISENSGETPFSLVKKFIESAEPDVEVVLDIAESHRLMARTPPGSILQVEDVTDIVLDGNKKIKEDLLKLRAASTVVQTSNLTKKDRIFLWLTDKVNSVTGFINRILNYVQAPFRPWEDRWHIPVIWPKMQYVTYNLVHFLSVAFEEKDYKQAAEALLADLKVLSDRKLIMGHLAMPSIAKLADTVGAGQNPYMLFCFPVIDQKELEKLTTPEQRNFSNSTKVLKMLGAEYSTTEGGINWLNGVDPISKYKVETVVVGIDHDANKKAHEDAFLESVETVNRVAAKMRKDLKS